ncbi:major facilitator superfamily transporter [Colletotrichum godetiae]|uniref:Major facilitator superfamily transporter n=1 Tax=Colletotrichum godetiae TaxID=1209918 RepID=A0AAJ0AP26_9PEZI|nr:major facilitator superfamily transporter [Colletotrichum godetiae]KAK1687764.1 major facilitator superfamily transporter [Colletotrichum godetiae]
MSDGHAPVTWSSLPRKDQLFLLFMIRFSEPVVRVSIGAYIYYQLKSLDPTLSSAEIITQSAYLQTAYTIAQAISSLLWGVVSDSPRGGRKLVVLMSLSGSFISCSLFGFITSFKQAVLLRVFEGITNGTVAMVRTMVSEVVQEKRFQARAFALLPIATRMAIIISPLVAGWTVQLETTGQDDSFVRKHPYALPALLNAGFLLLLLLATFIFLEDTSKSLRGRFDPGIALSKKIISLFRLIPFRKSEDAQYSRINSEEDDGEEMGFLKGADGNDQSGASTPPGVPDGPSEKNLRLPTRRIFTTNMLLVLMATLLYELHLNSVSVAMANMLVDPVSTKEAELSRTLPFRFGGGAGFRPKSLAWYSTVFGIVGIPMQIFVYPWLNQRFGCLRLWQLFYLGFPMLYYAYPYVAIIPSSTPPPSEKTGVAVWAFLVFIQTSTSLITSVVTPSQLLLANFSSPHPSALGRTHSITFFTSMAVRAASSALAGNLYAFGSTHNLTGVIFWFSSAVSLVSIVLTRFVREGNGHEIKLPGEE